MTFDDNGDLLSDYNIIAWDWSGPTWTFRIIGSSTWSPVGLNINKTKIQWHGENNQVMGIWLLIRSLTYGIEGPRVMVTQSRKGTTGVRLPSLCSSLPGKLAPLLADTNWMFSHMSRGSALGVCPEGRSMKILFSVPCVSCPLTWAPPYGCHASYRCLHPCVPRTVLKGTIEWLWVPTIVASSVCSVRLEPFSTRVVSEQ